MKPTLLTRLKTLLTNANTQSLVRHALTFIGGAVLAIGVATKRIDIEAARTALGYIVQYTGVDLPTAAVTTLFPIIWAVMKNRKQDKKVDIALALPSGSTREDLKAASSGVVPTELGV